MINFDTYRALYAEAREYTNIDMYIMERGWQDWMDGMDADQIADLLRDIHAISRGGFSAAVKIEGLKLTAFCKRYCLPYSTAQKWVGDIAAPAEYMVLHLGYSVISNKFKKPAED